MAKTDKSEQRKQRLAKALKANLARRKAQAKDRDAAANAPEAAQKKDSCRN